MFSLTPEGLETIANYKYKSGDYTALDNILNPAWVWLASFLPRWISPNAVTLTGMILQVLGLLGLLFSSDGRTWRLIACFVTMLAYQTFDALDGKHARNTGQSSPLGALFDHGCDAVVMIFGCLAVEHAIMSPPGSADLEFKWFAFFAFCAPMASFYMAQWEHYHTHLLVTAGCTEAQFLSMGVILVAAFFPSFYRLPWHCNFLPGTFDNATMKIVGGLGTILYSAYLSVCCIARTVKEKKSLSCLLSLTPFFLHHVFACALYSSPAYDHKDYHDHFLMYAIVGMDYGELALRMVIAGLGHMHYPVVHFMTLPYALVALGCASGSPFMNASAGGQSKKWILHYLLLWQIFSLLWTAGDTIAKVCKRLDIPFLAPMPTTNQSKTDSKSQNGSAKPKSPKKVAQRRGSSPASAMRTSKKS